MQAFAGLVLAALVAAPFQQAAPLEQPAPLGQDGTASESVYAPWENGPPTDPDWFPIGVWLQEPGLAERYAKLGVNTFVGLWKGPTENQLAQLAAAGMKVVCGLNKVARANLDAEHVIAWMQMDEPDNSASGRLGARATPEEIQSTYERLRRFDPSRPVWLNLGQGVANDAWKGRGAKKSDYPGYVAGSDIISFDVYPVTNIQRDDGEDFLFYVAKGVMRLREWGDDRKIVWNFIECTRGNQTAKKPTPVHVRAEVWMSLIHGSRGIVYFCHEFQPETKPAALLADPVMCAALERINGEVLRLAPALNRPSVEGVLEVTTDGERLPVRAMVKEHGEHVYVFAVGMRNGACRATFALGGALADLGGREVEVLGERRTLALEDGTFADDFTPYAVHLYRFERAP
jgi:hypothetical protein